MTAIPDLDLKGLVLTVQHNADVADARFAGGYTLCTYLMKMRDYYRWRRGLGPCSPVGRRDLGEWISGMESHWNALEAAGSDFRGLPLPGGEVDCFDNESVNAVLNPAGYVYAGVRGHGGVPLFFFADLLQRDTAGNPEADPGGKPELDLLVSGGERARSLAAPPAMSAPGLIFVRREALSRYLGSMVEEWGWRREDNAMGKVVAHYGFEGDPEGALERLVDTEMENVILHEIGERVAGALIGEGWQSLLSRVEDPLTELKIRAVRDNLADCLAALPACMTLENWPSVDFYYANMTPLRRDLFPSFCEAYRGARGNGNYRSLAPLIARARKHWLTVSRELPACAPGHLKRYLDTCAF